MSERIFRRGGSCLLEILIASILVVLCSLLVMRVWVNMRGQAKCRHAEAVLSSLSVALSLYCSDWAGAPMGSNAEMVCALSAKTRRGPYLSVSAKKLNAKGELLDTWGNPFVYVCPVDRRKDLFRLYSCGPDGKDDSGQGDDIAAR